MGWSVEMVECLEAWGGVTEYEKFDFEFASFNFSYFDLGVTSYVPTTPLVWGGGTHTGKGGTVMLGLFLVFVKPIFWEVWGGGARAA